MSNKWLKWAKNTKKGNKEQEIENLIEWLKLFYKSKEKEKNLILLKLARENESLWKWISSIKDFDKEKQERLYKQLKGDFV